MTPLLVVLPYCQKDAGLAERLVKWIADIGTPTSAAMLLVADDTVPRDDIERIADVARHTFGFVKTMLAPVPKEGWPPNTMFLRAARQIVEQYRWPFFWMEPDCVPLVPDWLEQLENEYNDCPKRFMGAIIKQDKDPNLPTEHLTGCAVYPQDVYELVKGIDSVIKGTKAWDIAMAEITVPRSVNTTLIHHFWGLPDMPPIFVKSRTAESPKNHVELSFINKDAVIFHRDKTHSLMPLLLPLIKGAAKPKPSGPAANKT